MKRFRLVISALIIFSLFTTSTFALGPTNTASPSGDLKLKLKTLQEEIASRAAQLKTEVGKKLQNKAYIGFVKSKSNNSLTLATDKETRLISLNDYTRYANQVKTSGSSKNKTIKEVATDDYIAALGDVDDSGVLTAKKIIRLTPPKEEKDQPVIFGEVLSLENRTVTIQTKQSPKVTVRLSEEAVFQTSDKQSVSLDEVKVGQTVIVGGSSFIYLFSASPAKPKTSTPSAKVSSPSAKR